MDLSPYRDLFVSETRIHLTSFNELIVLLERTPDDSAAINELFRHAHSLKGMAGTMEFWQVADVAHAMENRLSQVRSGEFPLLPSLADLLLEAGDTLARLVSAIEAGDAGFEDTSDLIERLNRFDPTAQDTTGHAHGEAYAADGFTSEDAAAATRRSPPVETFKSIRIKTETLDHLVNITGELITNRYRLAESIRSAGAAECREPLNQLSGLLRTLRDEVFKARMLPFGAISEPFPRLVRDLARKQGKEVVFRLDGREIELDRGILEELAEPLVHILRNAVDHGLESAEERIAAGKPRKGTIRLAVCRDKDHVEITVSDDGRGMDPDRLRLAALEKGLISFDRAAAMTSQEAYQLICAPGFSTTDVVTDVSGRGVGMDAVRTAVHGLSGGLSIQSRCGFGSDFVLRLPMTVSIIHALIVQCGRFELAFPLAVVTRTLELAHADIVEEAGRMTAFSEGSALPVRSMRRALELEEQPSATGLVSLVVCETVPPVAFTVDRIIGQQEIFVRPLRSPLTCLRGVSGATITGDGRVLFVVDAAALS